MRIETKPHGKYYAVVLREPDHSHGHVFAAGAVGGSSTYPVVDFGAQCVCCNRNTHLRESLDPSSDRFRVKPVQVPVCERCTHHAVMNNTDSILLACMIMVGIGGGLWALMQEFWTAGAIAGAIGALGAYLIWARHRQRIADTVDGHHPGLEHTVSPRQCLVRTTNRTLAQALADRHGPFVYRAR